MTRSYPYLYRFLQSICITVLVLAVLSLSLQLEHLNGYILYSTAVILFWELCRKTRYKKELFIGIFCMLAVMLLLGFRRREWILALYHNFLQEIWVLLALIPFTFFLSLLREKLYWLSGICLIYIIYAAIKELPLNCMGGIAAFSFIFLSFIEMSVRHGYGKKKIDKLSGLFVMPVCLAVCLSLFPVSKEPYPFTTLKKLYIQIQETAAVLQTEFSLFISGQSSEFSVNFTGYDDKNQHTIGASLLNNTKPALTVNIPGSLHGNLYLTGNIQNNYNENKWTFDLQEEADENFLEQDLDMDSLELLYALYETGNLEQKHSYIWGTTISLVYNGLYTKDMFFPLKLCEFSERKDYKSLDNKFVASKPIKEGDSYKLRYLALNYGSEELEKLIRSREKKVYQTEVTDNTEFARTVQYSYSSFQNKIPSQGFEALLADRVQQIRRDYMQIPDYLYADICALTEDVTRDADSDYDKLKAIEQYLRGFRYTQTPEKCDKDAVAAFLFDTQEGYCTYFASAFVLMSRAAGIPARYVNGFCIPVYARQTGELSVGSDLAHAWPEAYLTGIGWISFEPTAGYAQYHDIPWEYVAADRSSSHSISEVETDTGEEEEEEEMVQTEIEQQVEQLSTEIRTSFTRSVVWLCGLFPLMLALGCLLRLCSRKRRYKSAVKEYKLAALLYYELALLKGLGLKREAAETLLQYKVRVLKKYPELESYGFADMVDAYMHSYYGAIQPECGAIKRAESCICETERHYSGLHRLWILVLRLRPSNEKL